MNTSAQDKISVDHLVHLPAYADYLLKERLEDCIAAQIKFGFEINPPILEQFRNFSTDAIYSITKTSLEQLFDVLSNNRVRQYINESRERWKKDQLHIINRDAIVAEDITLISLLRKKLFTHFIADYSRDPEEIIDLVNEIDIFISETETASTNTYIDLLKERIQEHSAKLEESEALHKQAQAITHLGNYIWNLKTSELRWSDELYRIYGLPVGSKIDADIIKTFNHPADDALVFNETRKAFTENKPFDFHYRIILHDGTKKILHARGEIISYENGVPVEIIGTAQDVTERQSLIGHLKRSELLYRQAEELANMGTWTLDLKTNKIEWTDQLYKVYGLEPRSEEITLDRFLSFVHPDDRPEIEAATDFYKTNRYLDYTFRIITQDGKAKWLRSIAEVHVNEKGEPVSVVGTERDVTEKQALIGQLKQSEQLYKQAQALARLGNWSIDLRTHEFSWSDEIYKIYEIEKGGELSYEQWATYIHPDEKEEVLQYIEDCITHRQQYDKVHRIVLPGGKVKTIHRKGEFIFDKDGKPTHLIGTTQDVTQEFRVQQELKENQTFIRKITDATPSVIASYNVNTGKYVFISEGITKLLGYDPQQVMEKGLQFFADVIHPDDAEPIMSKNSKVLTAANADPNNNDLVAEFTYRMRHKNGQYRWFHTYGTVFDRNSEGKVEHVLNISLDITEQVKATEKIKEQEHFIQQIADASPTILYLFDIEKQSFAYINREVFFVLGYSPEEIIDQKDTVTSALYHHEDFELLPGRSEGHKIFQRADSMIQYECRIKHKDGGWRWFLVREIVFKVDQNGKIIQILGAALDITRRKEMEKTILQNTLQLEQSNASLEEFAYVASHDLKEPLRKISTFGDRLIALQSDAVSPEGKIYLEKIIDAAQRMQNMISDLLSISMISGNTAFEHFSLQRTLEEALQTLEFKIEQQNAIIRYDPLPDTNIIPSQFRQLFQNLLSNSLKFVKPGVQPVITITCSVTEAEETKKYGLTDSEKYYRITITDNGIGFENEFAGKIFAIFQRLHGRSEYEGSGIGLAICKKIVEHHGGVIYASGIPGEGATFVIILPA